MKYFLFSIFLCLFVSQYAGASTHNGNATVKDFWSHLESSILFVDKKPSKAAGALRKAVSIYKGLLGTSNNIDLYGSSNFFKINNNQDALIRNKAKRHANYLMFQYTDQYFAENHHTNNAGASILPLLMVRLVKTNNTKGINSVFNNLAKGGFAFSDQPMSSFESYLYFAKYFSDLGSVQISEIFLKRAISDLSKQRRDQRKRFIVFLELADLYFKNGDVSLANKFVNDAIKISKIRKIRLKRAQKANLQKLLNEIRKEKGAPGYEMKTALADFTQKVRIICSSSQKAIALTSWNSNISSLKDFFDNDDDVSKLIIDSNAAQDLVECFIGSMSQFLSPNGVNPEHLDHNSLSTLMQLIGLQGNFDLAKQVSDYAFDGSNWPVIQGRYRSKFQSPEYLGAMVGIYHGLSLAKQKHWLRGYLTVIREYFDGGILQTITKDSYSPVWVIPNLGIILELEGFYEDSDRIHAALQNWETVEGYAHNTPQCSNIEICEFFALRSQRTGNTSTTNKLYNNVSFAYEMSLSGASMSVEEAAEISKSALSEAITRESIGDFRAAITYFQIAGGNVFVAKSGRNLANLLEVKAAEGLARSFQRIGDNAKALEITSEAVKFLQNKIKSGYTFESDLVIRWANRLRGLAQTHLNILSENSSGNKKQIAESFLIGQYLQSTQTSVTLGKLAARKLSNSKKVAALIRKYQDLGNQLVKNNNKLALSEGNAARKLLKRISKLERRLSRVSSDLKKQAPDYVSHSKLQITNLADVQKSLGDKEALISILVGELYSFVWWVSSNDSYFTRLAVSKIELTEMVSKIRVGLALELDGETVNGLPSVPFSFESSSKLFKLLFAGAENELNTIDHLIYIPSGPLDSLPPSVFITEDTNLANLANDEYRSNRIPWLIRKVAISNLPSVAALVILEKNTKFSTASKPFFGIGDPQLADVESIQKNITMDTLISLQGRVAVEKIKLIPSLPETADELREMAEILGADPDVDIILRDDANEATIKSLDLTDYRTIAFATHGFLAGEIDGLREPGLVLTPPENPANNNDGLLLASEISQLKLNADLVILSACNTAGSNGELSAEGLSGIAQSFFYAGAKGLLVSHWLVLSKPTVLITTGMLKAANDNNISYAQGLQKTMLQMIDYVGPNEFAHPTIWAPFSLVAR